MDPYLVTVLGAVGAAGVTVVTTLSGAVVYLWREIGKLQKSDSDCRARLAQALTEMVALSSRLEQVLWVGVEEPNGLVVIDANTGLIVEWGPGTTMLFHWTAREMMGKPIAKVIPERFRQAHSDAMARLRASGNPPRHGPFLFMALTKEGTEIPVEVRLSGWANDNLRFYGASIRPRLQELSDVAMISVNEVKP